MKKLKTFFYSFKKSLFDSRYYKDVEKTSFWFSYKYLGFLIILILLIRSFQIGLGYLKIRDSIPPLVRNITQVVSDFYPDELEIFILNGKLITNVHEPYAIDLPRQLMGLYGKHLLVIDTQGSVEDYPAYNTLALATEKTLVFPSKKQNGIAHNRLFYFSRLTKPFVFDRSEYDEFLSQFIPVLNSFTLYSGVYVVIGMFLFIVFGVFFWLNGQLLFLFPVTFFVWLIALLCKRRKPYWTIYRFGMHALTWPIVLSFIFNLARQQLGGMYSIILIVWMLLIVLGNKRGAELRPSRQYISHTYK